MFLSPLGERLGEGEVTDAWNPLTQPLPQGGEEHEDARDADGLAYCATQNVSGWYRPIYPPGSQA